MKLLYKTLTGSHLHGTSTPQSDLDYVGIYLPSKEELITETVTHVWDLDTNKTNTSNTKEDVDYKIFSLHHWLRLLAKGETNAVDILFSIFNEETTQHIDKDFEKYIKTNYKSLLVSNAGAFIGYSTSQAKKYSLKLGRYKDLQAIIDYLQKLNPSDKIATLIDKADDFKDLRYVNMVKAPGPRKTADCWYLEVLGRKSSEYNKIGTTLTTLKQTEKTYSKRAKNADTEVEWKSLAHAVRIIDEVKELLETEFIQFPLNKVDFILNVKKGSVPLAEVLKYVEESIEEVELLLQKTKLPKTFDYTKHILNFY